MIFTKGGSYPLQHEYKKSGGVTTYFNNMTYWEALKQSEVELPTRQLSDSMRYRASRSESSGEWYGSNNFPDFMHKAKYGWSDGAIRVNEFVKRLENVAASDVDRPQASYDVQGSMIDIGKFVDGEPECMVDFTQQPTKKMVHLVVNLTASCMVSAETILRRGAAIVSLFNFLYRAGYSLKLTVTEESRGGGMFSDSNANAKLLIGILVKDFHDMFDLEKIIMAVAHPSFFRRALFGVEETYSNSVREELGIYNGGGYGRVHNFTDKELTDAGIEADIRLPNIDYSSDQFSTDEQAYGWVKKTLAGLGINLVSL